MATCSSDKTIRIHSISNGQTQSAPTTQAQTASSTDQLKQQSQVSASGKPLAPPLVLKGHSGPVWQVAWSHPVHNSLLASCSYDGKVIIWNKSQIVHEHDFHSASVNSVAWAPHEFGLIVGCASSDGQVSILQYAQDSWTFTSFMAHSVGVNSVSFCPHVESGELSLVSGGCDNLVKVWKLSSQSQPPQQQQSSNVQWQNIATLDGHSDWVRCVAWSPASISSQYRVQTIASCSPDKTVCIWTSTDGGNVWEKKQVISLSFPVWRVSWSLTGHLLSIAGGSDSALVYAVDSSSGLWGQISSQNY